MCSLVGVLIKRFYEMNRATTKRGGMCWKPRSTRDSSSCGGAGGGGEEKE